jgi:cysteine desulfurase
MIQTPVYLDNHATTRVDPRVLEAMLPFFTEKYGNSSSISHAFGWECHEAVEAARESIASAINATVREIVFTSGATESNNLAIRGLAEHQRRQGNHVVSVRTEHKAVLDPLERLTRRGVNVTLLDVVPQEGGLAGLIAPQQVEEAITDETFLVSVMLANNEIGVIQPLSEIGAVCRRRGVLLHTDATQAVGKFPVDVEQLQVDLMSFSAHKVYGPKGIGALYVRRRRGHPLLASQMDGGGQEKGLRSGTLNVPAIVGFARAVQLGCQEMATERPRLAGLRDYLFQGLSHAIEHVTLNGPPLDQDRLRLAHNLNVSIEWVDGEAVMMAAPEIAVSSGSACTAAQSQPSHVLRALGLDDDRVRGSLRFGLGRFTTRDQIDFVVDTLARCTAHLRQFSSLS